VIGFLFEIIGYILLGAATIVGSAFGFVYLFGKALQHSPNCQCPKCQGRRMRKPHPWKAVEDETVVPLADKKRDRGQWWVDEKGKLPADAGTWTSTLELRPGMRVLGRQSGSVYLVEAVDSTPFGYRVKLVNRVNGKVSVIPVQGDSAGNRIWLVRPSRRKS
jgi:DNA-directed RNA polymerase subunit RPC12/RpoP